MLKKIALVCGVVLGVAGCTSSNWKTNYQQVANTDTSKWHVTSVNVSAPQSLTTSEENSYAPNYDVVWHGEPYGDRRAQVAAIIREGIKQGSEVVHGPIPVRIDAVIQQFHAITPATRGMEWQNAGVHNILYTVQVFNAKTGTALTEPQQIRADLPALTGVAADRADASGSTQRERIVRHIKAVTQNWLGYGKDMRKSFSRTGR